MNKSRNPSLRRKANAKGRSPENGRHVRFHLWMMDSDAFRDLSPHEVRLLLEVYSLYSGKNNGWVFLSCRDAARRCKMSKDTASKCFQSLINHGFLVRRAHYPERHELREAPYFILTEFEFNGRPATKDFMSWKPSKK